ncbi:conserved protein of unknown function [Pseudodesulfovibrio profundus]|uniref:Methyltransferase type 11 domain-containing protein n=1 Tax=Pseudodesulfovibrio profundus TaxID=57320 RepID=A0A2C8FE44_9BACT|nr:methyltransferase domain-containing protein [Pseudodesulfovibrio profundus]SOB60768.1 conserved protein of unknown function [Pseudodesulfovibrio profundus]
MNITKIATHNGEKVVFGEKSTAQTIYDFIGTIPRIFLSPSILKVLGLTDMLVERFTMVLNNTKGKLADIGCGDNEMTAIYSNATGNKAIGIDVYDFGGGAMIVEDTSDLPFDDASFDTVSFVACLNHVPVSIRHAVLKEAGRILTEDGRIVITMINPFVGIIRHKLAWWDKDQHERGMEEEDMGLTPEYIIQLFKECGYKLSLKQGFMFGLNTLYVFEKDN